MEISTPTAERRAVYDFEAAMHPAYLPPCLDCLRGGTLVLAPLREVTLGYWHCLGSSLACLLRARMDLTRALSGLQIVGHATKYRSRRGVVSGDPRD